MASREEAAKVVASRALSKADELIKTEAEKKVERIRRFRREASRLASMANKRLQRLEGNKLTDSPAYQSLISDGIVDATGKPRFSIRGKSYNEVQYLMSRMKRFIDSETSTVRGANRVLKEMARSTGIKYKNLKELQAKASQFFELASKIEQYLRTVEDMASAIGYQKIWEAINEYVEVEKINLGDSEVNIEELTQRVVEAMDIYNEREKYSVTEAGATVSGWFQLDKNS